MATRDRAQVNAKKKGQKEVWRTGRVTVEVLRGRGLLALDKSGTSDPFVSVQLVDVTEGNPLKKPLDKVAKTGVCKKTLEPAWSGEKFVWDDVPNPLPRVRFTVSDYNGMLAKPKPLGRAHMSLEAIWEMSGPHQLPSQWLSLKPFDKLKAVTGDIEVRVNLAVSTGDEQLDAINEVEACRWFPDEAGHPDDDGHDHGHHHPDHHAARAAIPRAPNLLQVAAIRAKGLRAMDKAVFGGRSSDPFVSLSVGPEGTKVRTKTLKKNLNPVWGECLEVPLPAGGARGHFLQVRVEDADFSGSEYMGGCAVDLATLPPLLDDGSAQGRKRVRNSQLQRLISRSFSTRFG